MRISALATLGVIGSAVVVLAAVAATGPVSRTEWQGALADVISHGHLSTPHSCAAVVVARTHAPPTYKEGSTVVHALDRFLYTHCRRFGRIHSLHVGMTDGEVVTIAGAPVPWMSGPMCWIYRGRTFNALRVCFAHSRVSSLEFAPHG